MKQFLLAVSLTLGITLSALAQIRLGPIVGLNFTTLSESSNISSNKSTISKNSIIRGAIGCLIDGNISERFGFQTGLDLNWKGADFNVSDPYYGNYTKYSPRLNYLELPVSIYAKLLNGSTKVAFCVGPSLNYLLSSDWSTNRSGYIYDTSAEKKVDLGIKFGLQTELSSGLGLKVDYNLGVLDMHDLSVYTISSSYTQYNYYSYSFKNRALSLSFYWLFGGGLI